MGQNLIQGLDEAVIEKLRKRAEGNHRSFEEELREILSIASMQVDVRTARRLTADMRARLSDRTHSDSTDLIREDRDR
jgi:plasmid stability protein